MTGHYEFTKEEKKTEEAAIQEATAKAATEKTAAKKAATAEAGGTIRTGTYSTADTDTCKTAGTETETGTGGSADCQKEIPCGKSESLLVTRLYTAGCFSVSFVLLYGACFQAL